MPRLVLASSSPRRQSLLQEAGFAFVTHPAKIDESDTPPGLTPWQLAEFLADAKAAAVAARFPDDVVLGADTVVGLGDRALGKPTDAANARQMLRSLGGTAHAVITGVCLIRRSAGFHRREVVTSHVHMRPLSDAELNAYLATNDWQGKAGSYGIQDRDPFVIRLEGSLSNIVGLPMERVTALLGEAGQKKSC